LAAPDAAQATTARDSGLVPDSVDDQTELLQAAVDRAAERRMPLALAPERYRVVGLKLRPRTVLSGTCGAVQAESAEGIILHDISFDNGMLDTGNAAMALASLKNCDDISIYRIGLKASGGRGCHPSPAAFACLLPGYPPLTRPRCSHCTAPDWTSPTTP
jgi:hypothetical protein